MAPLLLRHRAIITGASRGIGLSIARLFAQEGASCLLVARSEPALRDAVAELETLRVPVSEKGGGGEMEEMGQKGLEWREQGSSGADAGGGEIVGGEREEQRFGYVAGEVGKEETWREVGGRESSPTILINAAGLTHRSLLLSTPTLLMQEILTTNLLGTILGCKYISKSMLRNKTPGCIINITSLLAHHSGKGSTIYTASKSGIVGFTRALAAELSGKGIRVVSISPGYVDTDMLAGLSTEEKKALERRTPVGRFGTREEVAQAVVFAIRNGFVNGVDLRVDGGLGAV